MPRDSKPLNVKTEGAVNGEACTPNSGPGSVPPRNQSRGQPTQNYPAQGQNESDMADLFSPVSESSRVQPVPCSVFDEVPGGGGGRLSTPADMPMSPFSAAGTGGMVCGPPGRGGPPGSMMGPGPQYGPGLMQMGPRQPMMPGGGPAMHPSGGGPPMLGCAPPHGKVYPPNQPMVFNPANPNAPPIYPCGVCHKEIHDSDQAILCESGCNFWFHRTCTGLTDLAYVLLTKEVYAEWVCDRCLSQRSIPLVKLKP
jgi:hypothetical protein